MNIKVDSLWKIASVLLVFWGMLFPGFHSYLGSYEVGVVNFPIAFFAMFFLLFYIAFFKPFLSLSSRCVLLTLLLYLSLIAFNLLYGSVTTNSPLLVRDVYDLYKPVFYSAIFMFFYIFGQSFERVVFIRKIVFMVFLASCVFGVMQKLGGFQGVLNLYTKMHNIDSGRVSAPFVNPYDYAFFMSFFCFYYFIDMLYVKVGSLILFALATIMMALTQSRSVFFTFLLVAPFLYFLALFYVVKSEQGKGDFILDNKFLLFFFFLASLSVCGFYFYIAYSESFVYLESGLTRVLKGEELGPLEARVDQFLYAFKSSSFYGSSLIVFGHGPLKSVMESVESIYAYYIFRYGILGFFLVFLLPLLVGVFNLRKLFLSNGSGWGNLKSFYAAMFCFLLFTPFAGIGNNFTEQIRLSFFYYMIIGLSLGSVKAAADSNGR